jgi:hypothetical protein
MGAISGNSRTLRFRPYIMALCFPVWMIEPARLSAR